MRIKETEPTDIVSGTRTTVEIDGATVWVDHVAAVTADDVRAEMLRRSREVGIAEIANACEARRSAIASAAPGKQQAYLLKFELVLRAESPDNPDPDAKALITTEATARGLTYEQLRDLIVAKRRAFETYAMQIETVEATAKAALAAAADRAAVDAAIADARQQLAGIGG